MSPEKPQDDKRNAIPPIPEESMYPFLERFFENAKRVQDLVGIYTNLRSDPRPIKLEDHQLEDLLRAAVVFLHATLEDILRTLAGRFLSLTGEESLNAVPLIDTPGGRPERFFLGRLARHRGKTIDDVIRESVKQHLERSNYSNTVESAGFVRSLGVNPELLRKYFSDLDALMSRRHLIVHRADRAGFEVNNTQYLEPLNSGQIMGWVITVTNFVFQLMNELKQIYHPFDETSVEE